MTEKPPQAGDVSPLPPEDAADKIALALRVTTDRYGEVKTAVEGHEGRLRELEAVVGVGKATAPAPLVVVVANLSSDIYGRPDLDDDKGLRGRVSALEGERESGRLSQTQILWAVGLGLAMLVLNGGVAVAVAWLTKGG